MCVCQARRYTYVGLVTVTIDIPRYRWAYREDCVTLYVHRYPDDVIDRISFPGFGQSHGRCFMRSGRQEGESPIRVSLYYRCPLEKKRGLTKRGMVSTRSPIRALSLFFLSFFRATQGMRNSAWLKCVSAGRPVHAFSVPVGAQSCISSSGNCSTELPSRKGRSGSEIAGCSECGLASPCREDVPFWCNRGMIARSGIRVKSAPGMSGQRKKGESRERPGSQGLAESFNVDRGHVPLSILIAED